VTGSFVMPVLSAKVRVPSAVLLIGYGLVVGPHALNLVPDSQVVGFLYEIGFIVLMFLAGMEIDFNGIRRRGPRSLLAMAAMCVAIFALTFFTAWLFGLHPIFGLALGATSVGLPLAVLKETARLRTLLGQTIVLLGSVGEFLTVIGMTLFYFANKHGFSWQLLLGLLKLAGVLAVAGLTLRTLMAFAWWKPSRFSKLVEEHEGSEIGVRAALFLMMVFSVLAVLAGVESIVGAFIAGALIAFVLRGKQVLEEKLTVVGHGLFVPIFFVVVGLNFDPGVVTGPSLLLAVELLVAVFLARLLPFLALLHQGLTVPDMLGTASLLSAPLTLMVAIGAVGAELGVLDRFGVSTLIVLAVATGVVFPVLFRLFAGMRTSAPQQEAGKAGAPGSSS
jgi:Kef-type K+ transport system membrane component KefB